MNPNRSISTGQHLWTLLFLIAVHAQASAAGADPLSQVDQRIRALLDSESIVGAQVTLIQPGIPPATRVHGSVALDSPSPVEPDTLFLIASCSKPFASLCVLSLIEDPRVDMALEDPIDRWLPAFADPPLASGGKARRAPTVEELLSHRAGIYSQKSGMTRAQGRWIRTFDHDLAAAVEGIASFPLISEPGSAYAYSGAGYCVLGRVAELAAGEPFEELLQKRVCKPAGLKRTTYFPAGKVPEVEIATGFSPELAPHQLGEGHRMPLIGGSLYSNAPEMAAFGEAVYQQWQAKEGEGPFPFSPGWIQELGRPRSRPSGYSLGWKVDSREGKPVRLSHSGALFAYRAWLAVNLESGNAIAGCWTLAKPDNPVSLIPELAAALASVSRTATP